MRFWALVALAGCLAVKGLLAYQVDLYADEAFYFQCSLRPGLAYADLPPLTALAVNLGTWLWGANPFGVRFVFLLAGGALPLVMYFLARQMTTEPHAIFSAMLVLIMPGFSFLSMLAIPDVLLALETALFLLFFERATRKPSWVVWFCLGLVAGLGILTHYRFATVIGACVGYLFCTKRGRMILQQPGIWVAGLVAVPGLIPALMYNWRNDFQPLQYFLLTRHDGQVRTEAWLQHLLEQMAVVSPFLWVCLMATLVFLIRHGIKGDDRARLFSIFAGLPLGLFFVVSPLHTTGAQSFHWPLPGYLPLLVYVPKILEGFMARTPLSRWRPWFVTATPLLAMSILAIAFLELGTGWLGIRGFREPFSGWSEVISATQEKLANLRQENIQISAIVADNYKLGAQLELRLGHEIKIYILDHSKNYEHGRQLQFDRWRMGESALRDLVDHQVLVLVQWSELAGSRDRWQTHLEWFLKPLNRIDKFHFIDTSHSKYDKKITFYLGRVIEEY